MSVGARRRIDVAASRRIQSSPCGLWTVNGLPSVSLTREIAAAGVPGIENYGNAPRKWPLASGPRRPARSGRRERLFALRGDFPSHSAHSPAVELWVGEELDSPFPGLGRKVGRRTGPVLPSVSLTREIAAPGIQLLGERSGNCQGLPDRAAANDCYAIQRPTSGGRKGV